MSSPLRPVQLAIAFSFLVLVSCILPACGGASASQIDGQPSGQGLVLIEFSQSGQDNTPINRILEFTFSEPVDPSTVSTGSIQVREGPTYGLTAAGRIRTSGNLVTFEPRLPTLCGKSDAALKPGRTYRVTLLGGSEVTAVRNTQGQPLDRTQTFEFATLPDNDPGHLEDQRPGVVPSILSTTPADGSPAVTIGDGNEIVVRFSENIDPCSVVGDHTVRVTIHQLGDLDTFLDAPNGNLSGFNPVEDLLLEDPMSWGGNATTLPTPVRLDATFTLEQDYDSTLLRIRPRVGGFPENSLIVVELTSDVLDFGGFPLTYQTLSFTTENLTRREADRVIEFDASTPIDLSQSSADVNTARSPDRAQAWLNFGGDGDNGGSQQVFPSWPVLEPGNAAYSQCGFQPNDGEADAFDPPFDVTLHTGSTPLPPDCTNESDGSTAVVWEFETLRIRDGVTVRMVGVNPGIILVRGDAVIESGGRLLLGGGNGVDSGAWNSGSNSAARSGGLGVAGGGRGGDSLSASQAMAGSEKGQDGAAGYGSPDYDGGMNPGGLGAGQAGSTSFPSGCNVTGGAQGGGGGGHATNGGDAFNQEPAGSTWDRKDIGLGGAASPIPRRMPTPSAGSGGGSGGNESSTAGSDESSGGAGGAGGGFVCITANGDIRVYGTIDASGGRGGAGGWDPDGNCSGANSGGGGGGAGGGIRLLCTGDIDLTGGTVTAAGGPAGPSGASGMPGGGGPTAGNGSSGRIVLEDGDSVITGMGTAIVVPGETQDGFFRGALDTTRFVSGSTESVVTTLPMALGAILRPDLVTFPSLQASDFVAGIPSIAAIPGEAGLIVEMQAYLATPEGDLDASTGSGWYTVGYFADSGTPNAPAWHANVAPTGFAPDAGVGIHNLDGRAAHLQVRVTFRLPSSMSPEDPGPYVDRMTVRFSTDA